MWSHALPPGRGRRGLSILRSLAAADGRSQRDTSSRTRSRGGRVRSRGPGCALARLRRERGAHRSRSRSPRRDAVQLAGEAGAAIKDADTSENADGESAGGNSVMESFEDSRERVGLKLLGGLVQVGTTRGAETPNGTWEYLLMDETRRCFAGILRGAVDKSMRDRLWKEVHTGAAWEQPMQTWGPMPRKTAWMVQSSCTCKYGYGGMQVEPKPWEDWMLNLMGLVMPLCGLKTRAEWPNSCNMNLYENGDHSVSWHADNEKLFQGKFQDCPIISLSLGQERTFELKAPTLPGSDEKFAYKVQLRDGDLCTMEGLAQKYYTHRVPRENKNVGARINLTWRWIVEHFTTCPLSSGERITPPTGGGKAKPHVEVFGKGWIKGKDKGKGKGKDKGKGKNKDKGKSHGKGKDYSKGKKNSW